MPELVTYECPACGHVETVEKHPDKNTAPAVIAAGLFSPHRAVVRWSCHSVVAKNACRTDIAFSCAEHVTWTRQYTMTRGDKALILIALGRITHGGANWPNWRAKKPANALALRAFVMVAGVSVDSCHFDC
jgi:hypothetical protein